MIYLERVEIRLGWLEYRSQAEQLANRLQAVGVECEIEEAVRTEDGLQAVGVERGVMAAERTEGGLWTRADDGRAQQGKDKSREHDGSLFVTDVSQIAQALLKKGCAVLVFLHDQNNGEDFSACRYACGSLAELDVEYLDRVYRRYRRLPWDILETKRCLVRETTEEDVEDFYRIYQEPSITEYMEGLFDDPEEELAYARDYIDQVYSFYNFGIWTVVEKDTGEVIGRAGICYREGYEDPEIGFLIAVPWQGQGIATEVCEAVLRYAREELGFSRILAFVYPENAVSVHICEKLGLEIVELGSA